MKQLEPLGIFETATEACAAATAAQKELVLKYTLEDRNRFIASIRKNIIANTEMLSQMELDETGYGRVEDKIAKNTGVAMLSQGTEAIPQNMYASDKGLTVEYYAPFGVVGAVTPVTNPAATVTGNGIANVAAGNAVVFNAHPAAKKTSAMTAHLVNKAITEAGGPVNLLTMLAEPSLDSLDEIMAYPSVNLLVGTGGPAMVKTLMRSGKKVIAAGAGNPPSIVDETVDLVKAAAGIYRSSSFDNNLLCIAEKEIFVVDDIFDNFMKELEAVGAYRASEEEGKKLTSICVVKSANGNYTANKKYVGKHANVILKAAGIKIDSDPRIAVFEAQNDDPLVHTEQLMPIIPIVRCKDFQAAMERAVAAEHDCKHSASIWSNDINRVTAFGKVINTTIFVQNGGTMSAFGIGGTGTNAPTIATPTGEGVTGPQSFVRRRRFCMAGGGNYLL
ncbi:aldehyde/histidinol dehydrogenase [Lucifera butyrica]|uniref:Aldehyde/histidinol dehydrogenase n=1 Tax=Lucifera butyrica TaxID=1351585 RepID=A0A498RDE2_9FIRM|nr:aldehyde dehydrogenase [Lucifera butyrica]VBB09574.1 aldehyde/histidinol dehydrogenase [Lucifera butyrica]